MNKSDLLQQCCTLIGQKLGWGNSDDWQNQDFETLSARIFDQTQVVLSVSTLKRVWGKVKYDSLPSLTTLNTLAIFAGYDNWRHFTQAHQPGEVRAGETAAAIKEGNRVAGKQPTGLWFLLPGILAVLALAGWVYNQPTAAASGSFSFSSAALARGIPNSVVFKYNAAAAGNDSVFIQQSWDVRRRFAVPANGNTYTSMYYYPGFFKAKLVVGKRIVKEHDLLIASEGWLAAVDEEPVPVYFSLREAVSNGALQVTPELLAGKNIALQPKVPEIRFYNIGDMQGLLNDNFVFETALKSVYNMGSAVCQRATVLIHCQNTAFMVPLGIPGCVAEMGIMLADKAASARNTDLSGFGCNMNEWVKLRCEVRNRHARFWVNGKLAYEDSFTGSPAKIVGVSYRFTGPGAVNSISLSRLNGEAVLQETFDK